METVCNLFLTALLFNVLSGILIKLTPTNNPLWVNFILAVTFVISFVVSICTLLIIIWS